MKTVLNVKVDPKLKKDAQEAAKAIGLPLSTVVSAGLREFVRTRSITISDEPRLKPEVEKELAEAIADYKQGRNISPVFTSSKEAADYLRRL